MHWFIHPSIHHSIHLSIYSSISIYPSIHLSVYSSIHLSTICSYLPPTYALIHPSIHLSTHSLLARWVWTSLRSMCWDIVPRRPKSWEKEADVASADWLVFARVVSMEACAPWDTCITEIRAGNFQAQVFLLCFHCSLQASQTINASFLHTKI